METETVAPTTLFRTKTKTVTIIKETENLKLSIVSVGHVAKSTAPQRDFMLEPRQQIALLPAGSNHRKDRMDLNNKTHRTL